MHITPILMLLVQLAVVLGACRLMGAAAIRLRQPRVVGEMLAGIMLGPSLLGWAMPGAWAFLFPAETIGLLNALAQLGVILFLFLIGLELDPALLRGRGRSALVISHVSIVAPLLLGAALTLLLYPLVFNDTQAMRFPAAALFMGVAMAITAFPVLARILGERGLLKTPVGAISITCAAIGDVTAWCLLAFVVAIGRAGALQPAILTAGLTLAYVAIMLVVVRPALRRLQTIYERGGRRTHGLLALVLLMVLLSSAITELIGIHALFGAFLLGAVMPKGSSLVQLVTQKLEDFTVAFLLPIFFAYAGLRTQIGLLDSVWLWLLTLLIILVACLGKFGGSMLAGRAVGMGWRESAAVGVLMNTRGLIELVIVTIGLQLGVISDAVFAMVVIMALVTTAMTTPILDWIYPRRTITAEVDQETAQQEWTVLAAVARPQSGAGLGRIAAMLCGGDNGKSRVYALTLRPASADDAIFGMLRVDETAAAATVAPVVSQAQQQKTPAETISFTSRDVASDIARVARLKRADLVLMGFHKPLLGGGILGGTVHRVLTGADADVAVLVDRGVGQARRVLVPWAGSAHDRLALELARRLSRQGETQVTVLHVRQSESPDPPPTQPNLTVMTVEDLPPVDAVLAQAGKFDLLVMGIGEEWGLASQLLGCRAERIAAEWPGSLLLVRKFEPMQESASSAAGST